MLKREDEISLGVNAAKAEKNYWMIYGEKKLFGVLSISTMGNWQPSLE
jgi:hypothetical protein